MVHDILSDLELTLQNASTLVSIPGLTTEEHQLVVGFIEQVLDSIDLATLRDRDKLLYLKLYVKIRGETTKTLDINDYVTSERQELIASLQ
jgi:hypothetical protein